MKAWTALLAGVLFGLGLTLAGMTQPAVVLGFLDLAGAWNPRLVFVMAGAVVTTAIGYRWVWRGQRPWLDASFQLPAVRRIDGRLLLGAALFGIGWGIAGYCPGPALASLGAGLAPVFLLVAMMVLGWWLAARLPDRNADANEVKP
ncbi:DUF6691 family protein [Dyella jiangningensis]|uniref:Transporter n=1 Tax=Dyella jiangningensis TaxID=1379159 RepID=A0A328P302_9GAMM|nr:DUF6691 family protein [Dyella jiangningensis]RAO76568.1 hypothetical protein CA260_01170 [Dyella jiangningensis]